MSPAIIFIVELKIHHFKLKREPLVVNPDRDLRFVVIIVQVFFEIFDIISHPVLVVVKII